MTSNISSKTQETLTTLIKWSEDTDSEQTVKIKPPLKGNDLMLISMNLTKNTAQHSVYLVL